jgi:hypothetical protein
VSLGITLAGLAGVLGVIPAVEGMGDGLACKEVGEEAEGGEAAGGGRGGHW